MILVFLIWLGNLFKKHYCISTKITPKPINFYCLVHGRQLFVSIGKISSVTMRQDLTLSFGNSPKYLPTQNVFSTPFISKKVFFFCQMKILIFNSTRCQPCLILPYPLVWIISSLPILSKAKWQITHDIGLQIQEICFSTFFFWVKSNIHITFIKLNLEKKIFFFQIT